MAEKYDMTAKILALVLEQCEQQPLALPDPTTQFTDLGFDWLAHIQLIMSIEEEFGIIISDEEAEGLVSIQAVVSYLQNQIQK